MLSSVLFYTFDSNLGSSCSAVELYCLGFKCIQKVGVPISWAPECTYNLHTNNLLVFLHVLFMVDVEVSCYD